MYHTHYQPCKVEMNLKILVTLPGATVWDKKNSMFKSLWQASKAVCLISSEFSSSSMLDEDNPPGNPNWGMASEISWKKWD